MRWAWLAAVPFACNGDKSGTPDGPVDTGTYYYTPSDADVDADADADADSDADTDTCVEAWLCSPWQTDGVSDQASRVCTDLNNCGTNDNRPVEDATLPALDFDEYRCNVEPILDRTCSHLGCHGTETGRALRVYARGRLRIIGETWIEPNCLATGTPRASETCSGSIECVCWSIPHSPNEDRRNYDAARGFALDLGGNLLADMAQSELLTQATTGGPPHVNVKPFQVDDADYTTIKDWLEGASLGTACHTSN